MTGGADRDGWRLPTYLAIAFLAQIVFWRFATPGPIVVDGMERGPAYAAVAIGGSLATLGVAAVLAVPLMRTRGSALALGWGRAGQALVWAGVGALVAVPVVLLQGGDPALAATYPWISAAWLTEGSPLRWLAWAAAYGLYYLAFEAFYRGSLLHVLRERSGDVRANLVQAVLATVVHVGKPLPELLAALPASLVFGWLTLRSRSIVPAVLLHLAIGLAMDVSVTLRGAP